MKQELMLNFICQNFFELSSIIPDEIIICEEGRMYNTPLYKKIDNGEYLYVHSIKIPRVYSKRIELDYVTSETYSFIKTLANVTILTPSDFDEMFIEPYQKRKLNDIKSNYIYLVNVNNEKEKLSGFIIVFANQKNESFSFNKKSVTSLFKLLQYNDEDDFTSYLQSLFTIDSSKSLDISDISNYYDYYIFNKDNNNLIMSTNNEQIDSIESLDGIESLDCVENLNDTYLVNNYINDYINVSVYYKKKDNVIEKNIPIIHIDSIYSINIPKVFSIIFIEHEYDNINTCVKKVIDYLDINSSYNVISISDSNILIIVNDLIQKIDFSNFENINYNILLRSEQSNITNKMNFAKLAKYIFACKPSVYKQEEYINYLTNIGKISSSIARNNKYNYLISSVNNSVVYTIVNNYVKVINNNNSDSQNISIYENKMINMLEKHIKSNNGDYLLFAHSFSLFKRKLINLLTNSIKNNLNGIIVITYDFINSNDSTNINKFYEGISRLKSTGVKIFVDSSVYLNLYVSKAISIVDGIYIGYDELKSMYESPNDFVNYFVSYYYQRDYEIIIDINNDEKYRTLYNNEKIYYLIRK